MIWEYKAVYFGLDTVAPQVIEEDEYEERLYNGVEMLNEVGKEGWDCRSLTGVILALFRGLGLHIDGPDLSRYRLDPDDGRGVCPGAVRPEHNGTVVQGHGADDHLQPDGLPGRGRDDRAYAVNESPPA